MNKPVKPIIIFTVLVDIIGIGIVIPTLPFFVTARGGSAILVTFLFAAYSVCSFISAPFLGALSDRVGRRPILIASIFSTALGWIIFAASKNILFLFLGRIVDGLAAGNISTAQSCLVDISKTDKERTTNLGLIGAMFGIGFIIGPLIGGILAKFSPSAPFWFAGFLALVNGILAIIFLPETNLNKRPHAPIIFNPFAPIWRALKNERLHGLFLTWFFFGAGAMCTNSIFGLYLQNSFGLGAFTAGLFLTGVGIIIALNQGIALKHFWLKYFKEPQLEIFLLLTYAVGYAFMGIKILGFFIFGLALTAFCQSVLRAVMSSQAVGGAMPQMKGEVIGIMTSIMSISMIVGPLIGGFAFDWHDRSPFLVGSALMLIALFLGMYYRKRLAALPLSEDPSGKAIF